MIFKGNNFSFSLGERTYIMGILNVTPDSFFDGGMYNEPQKALAHAKKMIKNGADLIDIGAQSTRPNHINLTSQEELDIIKQYLPLVYNETKAVISVDTFYPEVAQYALENGASIVNDVSGIFNLDMAYVVKKYNAGWIIMHTGGGDANTVPTYSTTVTNDVIAFFDEMLKKCNSYGISKENIMLDMGIGFGKTYEQNIELIKNVNKLKRNDVGLLTALSSKRVVRDATNTDGYDRVYGTITADAFAIMGGTDMIRVHNVKESAISAKMADVIYR